MRFFAPDLWAPHPMGVVEIHQCDLARWSISASVQDRRLVVERDSLYAASGLVLDADET